VKKPQRRLQRSDKAWLTTACLVVLLQFWWLPGDRGTSADSFSTSIEGSRGLFQTLSALSEQNLLPLVRRETDRLIPERPCTLLLLGPERYPNEAETAELRRFVAAGGCLVFASNWANPEFDGGPLQFRTSSVWTDTTTASPVPPTPPAIPSETSESPEVIDAEPATAEAANVDPPATEMENSPAQMESAEADEADPDVEPLPTSPANGLGPVPGKKQNGEVDLLPESPGLLPTTEPTEPLDDFTDDVEPYNSSSDSPLVEGQLPWRTTASLDTYPSTADVLVRAGDGQTQLASWPLGRGTVVVSASAHPFSNRSMLFARQAEFAVRLVEYGVENTHSVDDVHEIVVCEYLNGAGTYTGPELLISPALRIGTLQLILVGVLLAWFGFHRFGPVIQDRESERRSLAESATAVGNLQFQTNDGAASVRSYLEWLRSEARRRFGHDRALDDIPVLARHTGLPEDQLADAISTACRRAETPRVSQPDAAASIRNLAMIHHRLSGGGGGGGADDDF